MQSEETLIETQTQPTDWKVASEFLGGEAVAISLLELADSACFHDLLPTIYDAFLLNDWSTVSMRVSNLRSSCSYMGAKDLVKSCLNLESACNKLLEYDQAIPLNERERAKAEVIAVEAYLSLIQEIRRVKRQIGKIIKRPPDYCLIDKQENELKRLRSKEVAVDCCKCNIF